MMLGLIGLAIAVNSLWLLTAMVPFALVIRCDHPRGSLCRAQVRRRLSPLPRAGTALAVGLVGQDTGPWNQRRAVPATRNGMAAGRRKAYNCTVLRAI